MYMVIVTSSTGSEYLAAIMLHRDSAENEAQRLRVKWVSARVSCAVDHVILSGDLVARYETY